MEPQWCAQGKTFTKIWPKKCTTTLGSAVIQIQDLQQWAPPRKTPSKNGSSTPMTQGSIRGTYAGHCSVEFQAKPKITRQNKKQIEAESYKYGSGGRNAQYRNCFVCQRIGTNRSLTKEYCDICKVPVCSSRHLKTSKDGDAYICWNELHTNENVIEAARKKLK